MGALQNEQIDEARAKLEDLSVFAKQNAKKLMKSTAHNFAPKEEQTSFTAVKRLKASEASLVLPQAAGDSPSNMSLE